MRLFFVIFLVIFSTLSAHSEEVVTLWLDHKPRHTVAPFNDTESVDEHGIVANISQAELHVFPAAGSKMAVLVLPGGGYGVVSMRYEGTEIAKWLNANGITAAVLKYRLPRGIAEAPMEDAAEALKYLRANAERWGGYSSDSLGVMGFSAGGHLAAMTAVREKLAFTILFYPVITQASHSGSFNALIGGRRNNYIDTYTPSIQVTSATSPALIIHALDDRSVSIDGSDMYRRALCFNGVYNVFMALPSGGHGFGLKADAPHSEMVKAQILTFLHTLPKK